MNSNIFSPLTLNSKVKEVEQFDTKKIINKYKLTGIDVSRFFENIKEVKLYECIKTGYRFYYPYSTIGDDLFYEDLSKNRANYYSERWEHIESLKFIEKKHSILEIGSGFGAYINFLNKQDIDNIIGLELNPHAVKKCQEQGLKVKSSLIEDEVRRLQKPYDVVCYFQVLEHITNVNDFIQSSLDALKSGGKLIIGVPNNNPFLFINDKWHILNLPPHHAGLWNKKSIKALEKIFPIKLQVIEFEPIETTYNYFIQVQNENANYLTKTIIRITRKIAPTLLKKIICKTLKGRNILAVFIKK